MKLKTLLLIPLIASVISCGSGGSKNKLVQQDTDFIRTSEDIKEKLPIKNDEESNLVAEGGLSASWRMIRFWRTAQRNTLSASFVGAQRRGFPL
jgi:hypothetical protein